MARPQTDQVRFSFWRKHPLISLPILEQFCGLYGLKSMIDEAHAATTNRRDLLSVVWFMLRGCPPGKKAPTWEKIIRSNDRLAFYRAFNHFEPHLLLRDDARKVIYLPVPKAASSSILAYLSEGETRGDQLSYSNVSELRDRVQLRLYAKRGYFIFSFVRNPYARIVSFFRNKYKWDTKDEKYHANGFNARHGIERVGSFADLVHRIQYIPDSVIDRHLLPQSSTLYPISDYRRLINYVGKVENLAEDFAPITKRYDDRPMNIRANVNRSGQTDWRAYYTKPLAKMVYKRYRDDFELFGYQRGID